MKPGTPVTRLLDQIRERVRYPHGAGTSRTQRRVYHHGLHECAEGGCGWNDQPARHHGFQSMTDSFAIDG